MKFGSVHVQYQMAIYTHSPGAIKLVNLRSGENLCVIMKVAMEMTMQEKRGDKGEMVVVLWNGPASIFIRRLKI